MALTRNGSNQLSGLSRFSGGVGAAALRGQFDNPGKAKNFDSGEHAVSGVTQKAAIPEGTRHPYAWKPPTKAGSLSSHIESPIVLSVSGTALRGFPIEGASTITFAIADAAGELIVSGAGSSSITISSNTPLLTASLSGEGSSTITITINTPTLGAEANLTAATSITFGGSLTPYAIGAMEGTTEEAGLSVPGIVNGVWGAVASSYNDAGTMGQKLNSAASGGVDYGALADAVWTATTRTLTSGGGSAPTAEQVAAAVFAHLVESGYSFEEVIKVMAAALAGTSNKVGSTITFKGLDGVTDRIIGSYDAQNNRTGAVLNGG